MQNSIGIMPDKTIYLHIGTPKTGTTAIQVFLRQNRRLLNAQGYHVCTAQDHNPNRNLRFLTAYLDVFGIHELRQNKLIRGNEQDEKKYLEKWFEQFIDRLKTVPQKTIILSEEMLWWALCDADKLKLLLDRLADDFRIKVVVFLRRQDHYIMSIYQQALKACCVDAKTCSEWIADPTNPQVSKFTQYDKCLEKLADYVGEDNIEVCPYEKLSLKRKNVFEVFMEKIGLPDEPGFIFPEGNINPGLNKLGAELALCMNRRQAGPGFMSFISRFELQDIFFSQRGEEYNFLSPSQRNDFLSRYEEGNRRVAKRFSPPPSGPLFAEPHPISKEPEKQLGERQQEKAADILPTVLLMMDEMSRRMEKMEQSPRIFRIIYALAKDLKKQQLLF